MKRLISTIFIVGLLLALGQAYAKPPGSKPPGGSGGSGKGGFGELGDGCVTFLSQEAGQGKVYDDGRGSYCNGSDGQVSVPVRLRFDTKKFNPDDRYFRIWGSCIGEGGDTDALCQSPGVDGLMLNVGGGASDPDWNWTTMAVKGERTARLGIKIDNSHFLYYDPDQTGVCMDNNFGVSAGPIYVRCDADTPVNGTRDGLCDIWTISTAPDFRESGFDVGASSACYKSGAYGGFYNHEVVADFTMEVCVMGVSCD